ncbi:MAG: PadR family transcriptional regulator [Defluviitaleaceae bacterium]|nr:PadR family transcriptional regulator [Defluviitaleaceae bacterium]
MDNNEIITGLALELRRGTLVLLTLSQLKKPMYGYNLVKSLEDANISVEANTLYPLMRRLESQGLLSSEWDTDGSKPRKYYILTQDGKKVLEKSEKIWFDLTNKVNSILEADNNEGQ